MSTVAQWYDDRTVLVTGGAGFMGKVLLEKMLRALPRLRRVYLLLRAKRGVPPSRRVHDLTNLPVFERLRRENPAVLQKLVAVEGDLAAPGLGLSESDRQRLISEVSVVYHGAASLRLEADLKSAVQQNTRGTERVLQLCREMPKLEALVHLSTAFCHCEERLLEERVYPPLRDPHEVMRVVDFLDDASLRAITPELLGQHPNCYTFSKRLAETLVDEEKGRMPVVIVRPSIVTPSLKEPVPGWVDSLNGPIGLTVGAGKGVIRSMLCGTDYFAEVIPVDVVTNFMILAAWEKAVNRKGEKETAVFNVSNGDVVKISWGEIVDRGRQLSYQYPFDYVVWYPDGNIRTNHLVHYLIVFFFQTLPAYFIDFLMLIFLQKTFMVRLQKRISVGMEVLQYFTMRQWIFSIDRLKALEESLSDVDKQLFYTTNVEVDIEKYLLNVLLGARQYCMKEPLSTLPRARRHLKRMFVVHHLCKIAFYGFFIYMLIQYVEPLRYVLDYMLRNFNKVPLLRNFITTS